MQRQYVNMDDNTALFFERQLEHVKSKTYDVKYPELKARSLIPVSNEAGPGADTIKYEQYDMVGMAQIVANYASDFPRADIKGKEFRSPVRSLGASYGYSIQDIRAAQMKGLPLQARKANAAKRAILLKENRIAFFGDTENGLLGFFHHPNLPEAHLAADGTNSVTYWAVKSPELILRDLNVIANAPITSSLGVESADTLLLSPTRWAFLTTLKIPYSDKSVLKWFLENHPTVKSAEQVPELEIAGSGGYERIIAYRRSPDALTLEIPQDFEQFPPQEKGLEYEIPCHSRVGGVNFYYPLSAVFCDEMVDQTP